jgi:hypothetical protein
LKNNISVSELRKNLVSVEDYLISVVEEREHAK